MSDFDDFLYKRMTHIVLTENRPFCYADFPEFEVDGRPYTLAHGTYRNKISTFVKQGKIERDYCSGYSYHTLKGQRFGKPMTPNRMGVRVHSRKSNSIYELINNLPLGKNSLHDIRLCFKAPDSSRYCWSDSTF